MRVQCFLGKMKLLCLVVSVAVGGAADLPVEHAHADEIGAVFKAVFEPVARIDSVGGGTGG